jgi:hypothetical protein
MQQADHHLCAFDGVFDIAGIQHVAFDGATKESHL